MRILELSKMHGRARRGLTAAMLLTSGLATAACSLNFPDESLSLDGGFSLPDGALSHLGSGSGSSGKVGSGSSGTGSGPGAPIGSGSGTSPVMVGGSGSGTGPVSSVDSGSEAAAPPPVDSGVDAAAPSPLDAGPETSPVAPVGIDASLDVGSPGSSMDASPPPVGAPDAPPVAPLDSGAGDASGGACGANNGGCDPNATCSTTGERLVTCSCNAGYGGDGYTCTASAPATPITVTASSFTPPFAPGDALTAGSTGWMSAIESGNPEWLAYDFGAPVYVTGVALYVAAPGSGEVLQASNDAATWTTIYSLKPALLDWSDPSAPAGEASYVDSIAEATAYQYVRLYSQPATFLFYSWMELTVAP